MNDISSKNACPKAIGYSGLMAIPFPTVTLNPNVPSNFAQARVPLAVPCRVVGVSVVGAAAPAGIVAINVVDGGAAYEPTGSAAFGEATFSGTFSKGDVIGLTFGTATFTYNVPQAFSSPAALAAAIAEEINFAESSGQGLGCFVYSIGATLYCVNLVYGTAGNAIAFGATVVSATGSVAVSGATLSGGSGSGSPTTFVSHSNFLYETAPVGSALFPVNLPIDFTAGHPAGEAAFTLYPVNPNTFNTIFDRNHELTLRMTTDGSGSGDLNVVLWAVPVDTNYTNPGGRVHPYLPGPSNL